MRNLRVSVLSVSAVVFCFAAGAVWAAGPVVHVNVPFAFTAQGTTMPAGTYELTMQGPTGNAGVVVTGKANGKMEKLPIVTRLADLGDPKVHVVFDKVGDTYYLSEIHIPGMDGWELNGAPGPHTHKMVTGERE